MATSIGSRPELNGKVNGKGRRALAYPRRMSDGEQQVLGLRPHWVGALFPIVLTVILLIGLGAALVSIPEGWPGGVHWGVFLFGLFLMVVWPLRRLVGWVTSEYLITTERVIHRMGWLTRRQIEIPVMGVADVIYSQTLPQRLAGVGDVVIESAGGMGFTRLAHIENADDVHRVLYELLESSRRRGASPNSDHPVPVSALDDLERLAALKDRGALSEDEFDRHKRKLLDRL